MLPNSWEVIFSRASSRCAEAGLPIRVHPHQLRHTFAVYKLAQLINELRVNLDIAAGSIEAYHQLLGDPLQKIQRLLGHASIVSTYIYLDQVASRADTIDTAVEALLAGVGAPYAR